MEVNTDQYSCPVCGFDSLESKPYQAMPAISPAIYLVNPPYASVWGKPSYEVCPCCEYEFGFDDNPGGGSPGDSFSQSLLEFVRDRDAEWADPSLRPNPWNLTEQLTLAGIPTDPKVLWLIQSKKI